MEQRLGSSSDDVLAEPVAGGRALSTEERRNVDLSATIPGWGSDLDPARRPGVPRDKAPQIGPDDLYPPIEPQSPPFRIHKSTEHARLTPVFGTSCAPRGLSGVLRNIGYKFSEGRLARWLTLLAADRIDVVEGVVEDLVRLRVPNVPKEMGLKSELTYNRPAFVRKVAITGLCVVVAGLVYSRARRGRR
jgi:hypothetical protein